MKFMFLNLMVSFFIILCSCINTFYTNPQQATFKSLVISTNGIIVMEDEVMLRTDTQDPNDTTAKVEVFSLQGATLLLVTDCQSQSCAIDLSTLPPDNYRIVLTTKKGQTYDATVIVGSSS